jgi:20S proteasome alpha/beta subunit
MKKVYGVSEHVGILVAGSGELGALLMDSIESEVRENNLDGVTRVLETARRIVKQRYDEWFSRFLIRSTPGAQDPVRPDLVMIVAGYDRDDSGKFTIPRIYSMSSPLDFAPMLHDYGFALNGIAQYALYLLNRLYVPESPIERLLALACYVITETASQDGKVGGPVQVLTIAPETGCIVLPREETDRIVAENNRRSEGLKDSFFQEPQTEGGE